MDDPSYRRLANHLRKAAEGSFTDGDELALRMLMEPYHDLIFRLDRNALMEAALFRYRMETRRRKAARRSPPAP